MAFVLYSEDWLEREIEELRDKLYEAIEKKESKRKILYLSQKLDKLLDIYYKYYMGKK